MPPPIMTGNGFAGSDLVLAFRDSSKADLRSVLRVRPGTHFERVSDDRGVSGVGRGSGGGSSLVLACWLGTVGWIG